MVNRSFKLKVASALTTSTFSIRAPLQTFHPGINLIKQICCYWLCRYWILDDIQESVSQTNFRVGRVVTLFLNNAFWLVKTSHVACNILSQNQNLGVFIKMHQSRPLFVHFCPFISSLTKILYDRLTINGKIIDGVLFDSSPGPQFRRHRWIHWAMVAYHK